MAALFVRVWARLEVGRLDGRAGGDGRSDGRASAPFVAVSASAVRVRR